MSQSRGTPLLAPLLAGAIALSAQAHHHDAGPPQAADAATADALQPLVPEARRPRPDLITGGQPGPEAWADLAARGVTTVVNLRPDAELEGRDAEAEVEQAGMAYHAIPVSGAADLDAANAARLWHLVEAADGPVLVHCASGNRVGALLALGAAWEGGVAPEQALEFGRAAGLTSPRLEEQVRERLGLPAQE